mgnify:FL=1|tara:strand:- start:241 stop:480 length:240 start_codon:yes stop_codon:yes gene_type:complete
MNFCVSDIEEPIEKKAKILCDDLKTIIKKLEIVIEDEVNKKDGTNKKIDNSEMPPAGITSKRYAHIDNHLGPFINSLRN